MCWGNKKTHLVYMHICPFIHPSITHQPSQKNRSSSSLILHPPTIPNPEKQVTQVLARLCDEQGRGIPQVTQAAWRFLTAYDFPGNLEELEVVVEDALSKVGGMGGGV